jgi:hypothetical protein
VGTVTSGAVWGECRQNIGQWRRVVKSEIYSPRKKTWAHPSPSAKRELGRRPRSALGLG